MAAAVGLAVFALAGLCISVARGAGTVSAIWPVNAVVLAALIQTPARRWPGLLLAGFAGNMAANLVVGDVLAQAASLSLSNAAEILVCGLALRRFAGANLNLARVRHLFIFAAVAIIASLASAISASALLGVVGGPGFPSTLATWSMADALGLMIVTPTLLALNRETRARFLARDVRLRNLALLALVAATTIVVFMQPHLQVRFLVFAALVLLAYQTETAGAALGLLLVGLIAVALAAFGHQAWIVKPGATETSALVLQIFLLACAATTFPVAAAMARRRQLEADLAKTAREYRLLADHSTDIILRVDVNDTILYVSPSCRRYGYEPEQVIGRQGFELIHPEDLPKVRKLIADLFSGAPVDADADREQRIALPGGDWVWMEGSPQIVRDAAGTPIEVISQLRDITKRKQAKAALVESELRYRMLADRATDIIVRYDKAGVIEFISPSVRQFGFEPEQLVGVAMVDLLHPDERDVGMKRHLAALDGASPSPPEPPSPELSGTRVRRADGEWVYLEGNPSPIHDDAGAVVGAVTVLRDVTARRTLEEALRRKTAEAEAAAIAKSEFLANMSHEIRTPLTGILGFASLLRELDDLPPRAATFAGRIATAGQTLLAVVNDILDFSKIESGQIELDPQPFSPAAFVAESVELVAGQAQYRGLSMRIETHGELPSTLCADSSRLRQILLNLLTNAVKFTAKGGVTVGVAYMASSPGVLRISVTDTGAGISAEGMARLFQRFSQGDGSISRQYGGTGLGLAICKSLTELMGGTIGVESEVGRGSTFWFTIAAPVAEAAAPIAVRADEGGGEPARILIVDDVAVNRELARAMLGVFGHEITEAGGGAEAVEAALNSPFDLILMDLQMPGMDGLAATRAIRATSDVNALTPIVALSANVMPAHLEACRLAGMDDHIAKPIDPGELLTKVNRWTASAAESERERSAP